MKLGWLSDIHLNFLARPERRAFLGSLARHGADGWLVSGDIAEGPSVCEHLREFERIVQAPAYFVLGNHDFYQGFIRSVADDVMSLVNASETLTWLTASPPVWLPGGGAIVGDDGWADARLGDPQGTPIQLNDFFLIGELSGHDRPSLIARLQRLGRIAAARLSPKLDRAAEHCRNVIVVTHPPPYRGATWHENDISSPDWLPWMTCHAVGREIDRCAAHFPETRFIVLCGHTHSAGRYTPGPNITVHTAAAEYERPVVHAFLELDRGQVRVRGAGDGLRGRRRGFDSSC